MKTGEAKERKRSERLTLDVPAAAARLGVSTGSAYRAIQRGEIPSVSIGRRVLVPVAALEKLLGVPATGR